VTHVFVARSSTMTHSSGRHFWRHHRRIWMDVILLHMPSPPISINV
jgi:hypothetical protein